MKQLLFGAALAVLFFSCSKDEEQMRVQTSEQTARFGWQIVQEGVMTRAVQPTDAVQFLRTLMPSDADMTNLKIHEVALDKDVNIVFGMELRLRTGAYTIDYTYKRNVMQFDDLHVCGYPTLKIQHQWEVVNGVTEYTLPARYECCAVVWDESEGTLTINGHPVSASTAAQTNNLHAVFISDIEPEQTYTLTMTPTDTENYKETMWTVSGEQLTLGHYYVLQCNGKYQQAAHLVSLDDMEQGTL